MTAYLVLTVSIIERVSHRHLGEPICMIVGKTRQSAMDAAELVDVSYEVDNKL